MDMAFNINIIVIHDPQDEPNIRSSQCSSMSSQMRKFFAKLRFQLSKSNIKDENPHSPETGDPVPANQDLEFSDLKIIHDCPDAKIQYFLLPLLPFKSNTSQPYRYSRSEWQPDQFLTDTDSGVLWLRGPLPRNLETNLYVKIRVLSYGYTPLELIKIISAGLMNSITKLRNGKDHLGCS